MTNGTRTEGQLMKLSCASQGKPRDAGRLAIISLRAIQLRSGTGRLNFGYTDANARGSNVSFSNCRDY